MTPPTGAAIDAMSEADMAVPRRGSVAGFVGGHVRRLGWLMVDQAVFALTNMILNVMFARWLTAEEYGLYALSFSAFIFLSVLHWATVIEPLLVQAASVPVHQRRSFVGKLILAQVVILGSTMSLSIVVWFVAQHFGLPNVAAGGAAALLGGPLVLLLLTARRLCLVFLTARLSAQVGALYLCCALATAWWLHASGLISWWVLWAVMAGWSVVGAAFICMILLSQLQPGQSFAIRDILRFQMRYARAGSLGACSSWVRSDGFYVILAHFAGLAGVAETRAMVTLASPIVQVNSALNATWLVQFSRTRGQAGLVRGIFRQFLMYGAAALLGVALIAILHQTIVGTIYGGRFADVSWQLPLFCLVCCLGGMEAMLTAAIKATGAAWSGYFPQICGSITVCVAGALFASWLGQAGAPLITMCAAIVGILIATLMFHKIVRKTAHS